MKLLFRSFLLLIILSNLSIVYGQDRVTGKTFATRSEVIATQGMAATSHPLATQAALDILKKGGNAIDAAIAANALLGLVEPTGCGIGGDLFAMIWDSKTKKLYGINASGRSPFDLKLEYFIDKGMDKIPAFGPLPVTVPGCVDGWFEMHNRFGSLPMFEILQPAIYYAKNGFPVTELIAYYMKRNAIILSKYPGFKEIYMPDGSVPEKGEIFKNPFLAVTLEKIANGGRNAFYKGDIAETIVSYIKNQGGFLSLRDFAAHTSEWVEPVSVKYRGYEIWELPPNGQGIAVLQMLKMLEHFDLKRMGFGSLEYIHLFTEVKKLVFEDRAKYYADMKFNDIPLTYLLSDKYALARSKLIDFEMAAKHFDAGELEQGNTVYLTVSDKEGNMVSLIQSNYRGMGSGMTPTGLGFVLQDRGELFNIKDNHHFNVYAAHKRPFHTIIPAFITKEGKPYISFGLMGGAMQPQGHVQIIVNLLDFGMNLQEAGDAPRMAHYGSSQPTGSFMQNGGTLYLETGFDYEVIRELIKMGHDVAYGVGHYGGYQAIMFDEKKKVYFGASESRKDGQAAGY